MKSGVLNINGNGLLITCLLLLFFCQTPCLSQSVSGNMNPIKDSSIKFVTNHHSLASNIKDRDYKFSDNKLIIPTICIGYGAISLFPTSLKQLNRSTRHETREHVVAGAVIDNYMQYSPAALVYGLNLLGVKGKHNFRDRSIIYGTSMLISTAIVYPAKHIIREWRPDSTDNLSFPSGHTTVAFASAHFMFREYKDTKLWLALLGYPVAALTGVYRILNDKHWVGDVVAGAGIGILSTEISYWLFPSISKLTNRIFKRNNTAFMPVWNGQQLGVAYRKSF